ncbi:MAG: metal ABC transporter permease [archaeon]|nr:MAG: metal ABC transporter permease [archaeon]
MPDLLQLLGQAFIQRAFVIAVIIAVLTSVLSVFVVLKRVSLLGDGLAHSSYGGLALGLYLGVPPVWGGAVVAVLASLGITKSQRTRRIPPDAAVALFLVMGLGFGTVLISLSHAYGFNLESLLFGSILLVTNTQIYVALGVLAVTLAVLSLIFKELVYVTFDETQARASGVRTWVYDYLFSALAGISVIVSVPVVGVLLIAALIVLPGLTSLQVSRSFRQTVYLSVAVGVASVVFGLFGSIVLDVASGAMIVVAALGVFLAVGAGKWLFVNLRTPAEGARRQP